MALTNVVKDTEYINKLVEMKRYYRSENKIKELMEIADQYVQETDYAQTWRYKREDLLKFLREYFQLDAKSASYITMTNITDDSNNASYSFTIEIGKSPIEPKYAIGTDDSIVYTKD